MADEREQGIRIRARWPADANARPEFVNQYAFMPGHPVGQTDDEGTWYMVFGHVPPLMSLTEEDFEQAGEDVRDVEVQVRAQIMMGRRRAVEFWQILGQTLGMLPLEEEDQQS